MESQKTRQPDQKERKRDVMYNPKSLKAEEFISDEEIRETLAYADANKDNIELIDQILAKAKECKGLTHREASVLLACEMPDKIQEMYELAAEIKKEFYGNRIVLFAPLYLSNYVNIAATTVENYRKLKEAGIGTYILFQETYHKKSYEELHPKGPKHNYAYHTEAMDRAMEGGIDDVGLGVLFGLELYRYEFAGLLMHAEHLEAVHGVGPHTISVPRIKHADDIDPTVFDNSISDDIFAKICALIRIAVPYTGMIISTRESQTVREKVLPLGVSQISGASKTSVGGYDTPETEDEVTSAQFDVSDQRTLDEIVRWLMEMGDIPSFCTACYRAGRTGDRFMSLCKSKQILNCCHPNALMTLMEYLQDYASPKTKEIGMKLIEKELDNIPSEKVRRIAEEHLRDIENGQRDFRF